MRRLFKEEEEEERCRLLWRVREELAHEELGGVFVNGIGAGVAAVETAGVAAGRPAALDDGITTSEAPALSVGVETLLVSSRVLRGIRQLLKN